MFSIVVPLYNKECYVINTLKSILNQTCKDYEVIIINDGSTDRSKEVVSQFILSNCLDWKLLSTDNSGVSNARNQGVLNAVNDYIVFIDSDDVWRENLLNCFAKEIAKNKDAYFLASNYQIVDDYLKAELGAIEASFIKTNYIDESIKLCSSSVCVKRSIFEDEFFLFDLKQTHGEDSDVWFKISLYYDCFYSLDKLAFYVRADDKAATSTNFIQKLDDSSLFYLSCDRFLTCKSKKNAYKYINKRREIYIKSNIMRGHQVNARKIVMQKLSVIGFFYWLVSFVPLRVVRFIKGK